MGTALCRYTLGDASEVELARFLWDTARALWAARRLGLARLLVETEEEEGVDADCGGGGEGGGETVGVVGGGN